MRIPNKMASKMVFPFDRLCVEKNWGYFKKEIDEKIF